MQWVIIKENIYLVLKTLKGTAPRKWFGHFWFLNHSSKWFLMLPQKDGFGHYLYVKGNNKKTCIQCFFLQIWYASLIKLNWCIQLQNAIHNVKIILMHACIKKWKSPCHKWNQNVIPNLIQYVYVIPLWNALKLKFLMIWS